MEEDKDGSKEKWNRIRRRRKRQQKKMKIFKSGPEVQWGVPVTYEQERQWLRGRGLYLLRERLLSCQYVGCDEGCPVKKNV